MFFVANITVPCVGSFTNQEIPCIIKSDHLHEFHEQFHYDYQTEIFGISPTSNIRVRSDISVKVFFKIFNLG